MVRPDRPIVLFEGGADGYGDAVATRRQSYAWSYNTDCRSGSQAVPSTIPGALGLDEGSIARPIKDAFEWETNDSVPIPLILMAGATVSAGSVQRSVGKIRDGSFAAEDTRSGEGHTAGILYRHDGSDPDTEMAFFVNGDGQDVMLSRTKAGVYAATGTSKADLLSVVGSHLWRTEGYVIRKLTVDTDPMADASFPTPVKVGRPTFEINTVLELGGAPIPAKGDGVFKFNPAPSANTFENITPFIAPDKDNGKGSFIDGRGRVWFLTVDGDVLVISFGTQSQQRPARFYHIDRDTPFGRIDQMAADANQVYAALEPGGTRTQELGLTLLLFDASANTFSNPTVAVTDRDLSTSADLGSIGDNANADYVYVGADEPFWGGYWKLAALNTGTALPFTRMRAEYSAGSGNWKHITVKDSTMAFTQDGCIAVLTE